MRQVSRVLPLSYSGTTLSTYEFDKVCADDELQSKKIIKFRLGGRAHSLTLLEFARRMGLYQAVELEEEGFNVYFEGEDDWMDEEERSWNSKRESNLLWDLDTITLRDLIDSDGFGAYNPPGYAQPQYDQYYQQYPPPPPQYQQHQTDDDE
ncbi:hypothetical protein Tco_1049065 [Tanacetum coccineum]